jgi:hypothetical protein
MLAAISSVQQVVAAIRQQAAARSGPFESRVRKGNGSAAAAKAQPRELGALIAQRIKAIGPDDPGRGRKTFRVFIESMLLAQFGEDLINDPQFYRLVDDVQQEMEADPALRGSVDTAIEHLLKTP